MQDHLYRLKAHCKHFSVAYPGDDKLIGAIDKDFHGLVKIAVYKNKFELAYRNFDPLPKYPKIILSKHRLFSQEAAYKTSDRGVYNLALKEARACGAHEALLMDEMGRVIDGTRTAFVLFDGKTFTVPLGGLKSITRMKFLRLMKKSGFQVKRQFVKAQHFNEKNILLIGSGAKITEAKMLGEIYPLQILFR